MIDSITTRRNASTGTSQRRKGNHGTTLCSELGLLILELLQHSEARDRTLVNVHRKLAGIPVSCDDLNAAIDGLLRDSRLLAAPVLKEWTERNDAEEFDLWLLIPTPNPDWSLVG